MKMKLVFVGVTALSIIFLSQKVSSFTEVAINSDTSIKITDQKKALISLVGESSFLIKQGETKVIELKLKNRVANLIELQKTSFEDENLFIQVDKQSFNGREGKPLLITVTANDQTKASTEKVKIPLDFKWESGSATIPAEIKIDIEKIVSEDGEKLE